MVLVPRGNLLGMNVVMKTSLLAARMHDRFSLHHHTGYDMQYDSKYNYYRFLESLVKSSKKGREAGKEAGEERGAESKPR